MKLWFDSKMDKFVLDYFKKALEYEIGVGHIRKTLALNTSRTSSMTVFEYKLTAPQVNSAIKNLDRLLDLPVIDVNAIVSVASSNAQLFNTDESRDVVTSIVTKAYENLRDVWRLTKVSKLYHPIMSNIADLILSLGNIMNDVNGHPKTYKTEYLTFYKNIENVRDHDWDNVLSDSSSIATINENRYLIRSSSLGTMSNTSFQSFRPNLVSLDEVTQLTKN